MGSNILTPYFKLCLFCKFNIGVNLYFFAQYQSSVIQGSVIRHIKIPAINFTFNGKTGSGQTIGIFYDAAMFNREFDIFCNAM